MSRKASPRAVAKAAAKKPLAGYLRLTVDRHGNKIGYDVQMRAIERWAEYAGETIGHWYKDKDITAADRNKERPEYEAMLADVEAGVWGGVVVWRLDRLVRLMYEIERCFRIMEDSDAFIVSIDPTTIDSRDPLGKIFMRILVMFAEMEIDTMKSRARGHRQERARDGMYNGGGPRPFGFIGAKQDPKTKKYLNVGEAGVAHNREEADLIRWAADKILEDGWSWSDVLNDWAARTPPVLGTTGKPMSIYTLQRILTGPRVAGKREYTFEDPETGEEQTTLVTAKWEPILDEDTWKKLGQLIAVKGKNGPKELYLLSGLLLCGKCKRPLTGARRKYEIQGQPASTRTYRCRSDHANKQLGSCGKLSVVAESVERIVIANILTRFKQTPELLEALARKEEVPDAQLVEALETIRRCDEQAKELGRRLVTPGTSALTMSALLAATEQLDAERSAATAVVDRFSKRLTVPVPDSGQQEDLMGWFVDFLSLAQQRKVVTALFASMEIAATGRSGRHFNPNRLILKDRPLVPAQ